MSVINSLQPTRCALCGYFFTVMGEYAGYRCLDPAHWQAAGLLSSTDFYPMALLAAQAQAEQHYRLSRRRQGNY